MRRLLLVLSLVTVTAAWSTPAAAAGFARIRAHSWEGIFTGSRLSTMGGADLAGDDGPGALLVNPAPLMRGDGIAVGYDHVDYPLGESTTSDDPPGDLDYVTAAVNVEWRDWRFSTCISDESLEDGAVRTAYQPESTGTIDSRSRMALVGLARQLVGNTKAEQGLQWTVGAAYRSYSQKTTGIQGDTPIEFDDGTPTGTWDVGTTAAYRLAGDANRASIAATIAWQNVTGSTWNVADRELDLHEVVRMGLTTGMTFLAQQQREWVRVVGAIARTEYTYTSSENTFTQYGIEITVLRLLALRAGSNDRFYGGSSTWGVGLALDHPGGRPWEVAFDYGEMMPDNPMFPSADIAMWSGRLRLDF